MPHSASQVSVSARCANLWVVEIHVDRVSAPLSPLAALFLRYAPDNFLLTNLNTFRRNRDASVATLR